MLVSDYLDETLIFWRCDLFTVGFSRVWLIIIIVFLDFLYVFLGIPGRGRFTCFSPGFLDVVETRVNGTNSRGDTVVVAQIRFTTSKLIRGETWQRWSQRGEVEGVGGHLRLYPGELWSWHSSSRFGQLEAGEDCLRSGTVGVVSSKLCKRIKIRENSWLLDAVIDYGCYLKAAPTQLNSNNEREKLVAVQWSYIGWQNLIHWVTLMRH